MRYDLTSCALLLTVTCILSGCLTGSEEDPDKDTVTQQQALLCDGSDEVRLSYVSAGGGPVPPGSALYTEHGFEYLHINGKCEYWAYKGGHTPITHGTLTEAEAEDITARHALETWKNVEVAPKDPVLDAGTTTYTFGEDTFSCHAGCSEGDEKAIQETMRAELDALYQAGTPLDGPVKVLVMDISESLATMTTPTTSWPLGTPVTDYVVTYGEAFETSSHKMLDGVDAATLRAMRDQLNAGDFAPKSFIPIKSEDGTKLYELHVADVLPIQVP